MSEARFRAGCGRERLAPADLADLAYVELAFVECPSCRHRVEPDGGPAFCRWLRTDLPGPFAALAGVTWDGGRE